MVIFRVSFITEGWNRNQKTSSFSEAAERMAQHVALNIGAAGDALDSSVKQKICDEARVYMDKGNCRLRDENNICVNPTLLHPTTQRWQVHYTLSPYDGFLPFSRYEKLDTSAKSGILTRSCQNILKSLVSSYRRRVQSVKVFFYLQDALEFCYGGTNIKFDVIDCSNLADHVGLVNLINACRLRLADHPEAIVQTESMIWKAFAPSVLQYLEEILCCPLSMIPTIYGFRLVNHVELGSSSIPNFERLLEQPFTLRWKNTSPFKNAILYPSPALIGCLERLASKCYLMLDMDKSLPLMNIKRTDRCCTPLTFQYVASSLALRGGSNRWIKDVSCQLDSKLASSFHLSKRTIQSWEDGLPLLKLTAEINVNEGNFIQKLMASSIVGTPVLRLILVPNVTLKGERNLTNISATTDAMQSGLTPNVHFIDNVRLEMKKTFDDQIESVSISFLLVPDHGLEETHFMYVVDLSTRMPIFVIESMKTLQVEKFQLHYPFAAETDLGVSTSESELLVTDSCVETEDQYTVKINIVSRGKNVSGKFLRIFVLLKQKTK